MTFEKIISIKEFDKMAFDITEYKLKHIVSLKPELLDRMIVLIPIEGVIYQFRADKVASEIIELVDYVQYDEVKMAAGPLEKELKNFTYGKSRGQLSDHEVYEIRFSKFKLDILTKEYEFEITGVGPRALRVSLNLRYDHIEGEETRFEQQLKEMIMDKYSYRIENNPAYQNKLKQMKKDYEEKRAQQDKIREEVRREQAEKERKMRELEERLNANKPKERPFKRY